MTSDGTGDPPAWEQFVRQLLGPAADEAIKQLRERGLDPATLAAAGGLHADPAALEAAFGQLRRLVEASGDDSLNWPIAHDLARQTASAGGDPSLSQTEIRSTVEALTVADLWLDAVTTFDPAPGPRTAWSRAEWVEATLPAWRALTEPLATSVTVALGDLLASASPGLPPSLNRAGLVRRLGATMFGIQMGQATGTLAREVFGTTDVGVPLLGSPVVALVTTNVGAFADGLDAPVEEVRLVLAVREAAAARLFAGVPWLRGWLTSAVETYARGIAIDPDQLGEAVRGIDLSDPQSMTRALSGGVFQPRATPEQEAALARLGTALALVEGWVDEVSAAAVAAHLPHAVPLREMLRRRRASGGPAEHTFATLVGLELRPRRLRDAARLWAAIAADSGTDGRDGVWLHPDLMPDGTDLDDPDGYAARRRTASAESADLDQALADILGDQPPDAD